MKQVTLKFSRKKLNIVDGQSKAIHDAGNGILFNEEVLEANLCD